MIKARRVRTRPPAAFRSPPGRLGAYLKATAPLGGAECPRVPWKLRPTQASSWSPRATTFSLPQPPHATQRVDAGASVWIALYRHPYMQATCSKYSGSSSIWNTGKIVCFLCINFYICTFGQHVIHTTTHIAFMNCFRTIGCAVDAGWCTVVLALPAQALTLFVVVVKWVECIDVPPGLDGGSACRE